MASMTYQDGSLKLTGEMTHSSLGRVSRELLAQAGREGDMTLDLAAVQRCDSACVAMIAACKEIKQRQKDKLLLVNVPKKLVTLFKVYGLEKAFKR